MFVFNVCRECACWDLDACATGEGPCWWVDADLCSRCQDRAQARAHAMAHAMGWPHGDESHPAGHAYIPQVLVGVIADRPPEAAPFA